MTKGTMPPLRLHAETVQEALDRADSRHWTRNPPHSAQARLNYLQRHHGGDRAAVAAHLGATPQRLEAFISSPKQTDSDPLRDAIEREVIRLWQPRIRRQAHHTILDNGGYVMVSFRAWLGFTAAGGSSDDPRLRTLSLGLDAPHPACLFEARHRNAPERQLLQVLSAALGACYFHRNRPQATDESVTIDRVDYLEFYY
ncbi:telomere-protecting terminal protein Tpg [Streptomyces sp. NPDC097617]|uniref:telomere-protecting terminal protein Tpg n=1 Tax=Streptomyces sp. NPDC097617 TaxID=3366091 RepID=UPI003805663C